MSAEYSEDRLVQRTTADYFEHELGWHNVWAYDSETYGPGGTLGRADRSGDRPPSSKRPPFAA